MKYVDGGIVPGVFILSKSRMNSTQKLIDMLLKMKKRKIMIAQFMGYRMGLSVQDVNLSHPCGVLRL